MIQKLFKYAMPVALGVLLLAGCKDDEAVQVKGVWNATEDYADVSFVDITKEVELDPSDPTTVTLRMKRRNADVTEMREYHEHLRDSLNADTTLTKAKRDSIFASVVKRDSAILRSNWPAIDVPIVITNIKEGGNDTVFTVTKAHFDQSEEYGTFDISFDKAEIGIPYSAQLAVTDEHYTSAYSNAATSTFTVTRVKWNLLGTGTFIENFVYEASGDVEIYQKDNDHDIFRILKPFNNCAVNGGVTPSGKEAPYMIVTILQRNSVLEGVDITVDDLVHFTRSNTGYYHSNYKAYIEAFHPADLLANPTLDSYEHSKVLSYQENGLPGQIQLAPYYYMVGVGGWNNTTNDGIILINFPGFTPKYTAQLNYLGQDGDFQWDEVFQGSFTSGKNGSTGTAKVYKATCTTTTDQCDSIFAEAYGTPYVVEAPYADGYDIYFFVKNGRISIPNDFLDYFELQPIGLDDNMGNDIYAKINGSSSSFSENEVVLNMTFQNKDGSLVYGDGNEIVANITWSKVATGTFWYNFFAEGDEPDADPGYDLLKRDDRNDQYQVAQWLTGLDGFYFSWNKTTNACVVAEQPTYYEHPSYGMIYFMEGADFDSQFGEKTSYYDPAAKTFHFFPVYFVSAGYFGQYEEVFEITEEGAVKHKSSRKISAGSLGAVTPFVLKNHMWQTKKAAKTTRQAGKKANFQPASAKLHL